MAILDQRENALETEFFHREELKFRVRESAVKSLAVWAAGRLGKTGDALEAYARDVVAADVANPTIETTIDRIVEVLAPKGISKKEICQMMDRFTAAADSAVRKPLESSR